MEVTDDDRPNDPVTVYGMMDVLISGNFASKDDLYQKLEDVYRNFTSIHKAVVVLVDELHTKFPEGNKYIILKKEIGFLITYSRYTLKRIFEEDGITINQSLADILTEIELHMVDFVMDRSNLFYEMTDMMERVREAYGIVPWHPGYQLIDYDMTMEFLDQFLEDLDYLNVDEEMEWIDSFVVLRNYLELLTKERIVGNKLERLLIAADDLAYKIIHFFFIDGTSEYKSWEHYDERFCDFQSDFRFGVLKALVLQTDALRSNPPLMSNELVIGYVNCVRENLLQLPKIQRKILDEGLSFLMHLLIIYTSNYDSYQDKLSNIRLDFQALARNVGSVVCSCVDNPEKEETSLEISDLIEKIDFVKGEIIETIFCIALQTTERESPKQDQLGSLIILLQNLKDCKAGSLITWKDHENLVLFVFYLIHNNIRDHINDDEYSRKPIQFDVALLNHEELNRVLISAQVVSLNMACCSLLRRHEKLCWWELYFGRKENVYMHMRIGILKAIVLSSTTPLTDELLIAYVDCIQDNVMELQRDEAYDPLKDRFSLLREGISFLVSLLISCSDEQEKLHIKAGLQDLVRSVGSVVCSCLNNSDENEMSLGLIDLIEKMKVIKGEIKGETIKAICCNVLKKTERESPKQDQMGFLILLLQNLKEFMDGKPDLSIAWKDLENLVLFIVYLIQNDNRDGNRIGNDEFSPNTIQYLDVALINQEELNRVLISAQVVAFNMACCSLLRKYGKLRWWELYLVTEECVDLHMRIGILNAIVLSITTDLTAELLIAYVECVRDCLVELLRDESADPLKDQFNILHEELSFLVRLFISFRHEQEKLSHIKVSFQDLVRRVGYVICSCFNYRVNGDTEMKDYSSELSNLVEKMNLIIVETEELLHLVVLSKIGRESPKTNQVGSLSLLLENWKGLMECESDLIITWKEQFQMIHENLVLFKAFLTSRGTRDDESQKLCSSILDAGHVAEYLLTTFSVGTCPAQCRNLWIPEFMKHVELIKTAIIKANEKKSTVEEISTAGKDPSQVPAQALLVPTLTDVVMGFEVEMELIRERLAGHLKQLDVISIVGMPGLGKTTLARKVYEDQHTKSYFDVRAWCCVSQEYNKKELLLEILGSLIKLTNEIRGESEMDLSLMVHKQLTGRRYIVVLDDIWDINAFMYLKRFCPENNNGSRIMLTSRSKVIGSQAQSHECLIEPCVLTDEQSWDLFERKVYNEEKCAPELCQIGKEIVKKCKGLPLGVVVVAGILAKGTQTRDFWEKVMVNLSSYLARDSESGPLAALELSYKYLPDYLKPMFLYLGAFSEDKEIPVNKLVWLWIAEGFVHKTESLSLEIQAEKNLRDLIDRSLVMVAKRSWDGGAKTCRVHDLLRDMCLAKAKEEKFMLQVHVHSELPYSVTYQRRLSIILKKNDETTSRHLVAYKDLPKFSITPPIYSLLFFHVGSDDFAQKSPKDLSLVISSLKLLKVFDDEILEITQDVLDKDLITLVHLRYVSICGNNDLRSIPSSISQLQSLETLIIHKTSFGYILLPETIWEMKKLRHLHIDGAIFNDKLENLFNLDNLQTLSDPDIDFGEEKKLFRKVPDLKTLQCIFYFYSETYKCPNFKSLGKLECLEVRAITGRRSVKKLRLTGYLKLPMTLKKLSISYFRLKWSQISMLKTLPNLEVLKLLKDAVEDDVWDMGDDDVFTNLKFLKLRGLKIDRWFASSVNFPCLEKLVLESCEWLEEIPSDLGEFNTLQNIEVKWCNSFVEKSVMEVKEEQEEFGNNSLKVYFYGNKNTM